MNNGYRIRFRPTCRTDDVANLFRMARMTLEELRGKTGIGMTCRHSITPDGLTYEVNADNQNARDLAVVFLGTSRRILGEECCYVTPIYQRSQPV